MANTNICKIEGCRNGVVASGLCNAHYKRLRKYGDPLTKRKAANGEARGFFEGKALGYEGKECLIWPFHRGKDGYGQLHDRGQNRCVSRLVCERTYGPPPTPEYEAAHSCGKGHEGCVTKAHLSWKTHAENEKDKLEHGTQLSVFVAGEGHINAKISDADVMRIRSMSGVSQAEIAKFYSVSRSHIGNILSGARRSGRP